MLLMRLNKPTLGAQMKGVVGVVDGGGPGIPSCAVLCCWESGGVGWGGVIISELTSAEAIS